MGPGNPTLLPGDTSPQRGQLYPASLAQRRLWFLDQLQGPTSAYNVDIGLWLYGALDLGALQSGLQAIVDRHDSLRTTFRLAKHDLVQIVAPSYTITLPIADFTNLSDPYPPAYEYAKQEVETPFDLGTGPLFRARLIRIAPEEHVLLCTMHHAITDAWSMQIFAKELAGVYERLSNGKPPGLAELPLQYGDFSEWQHESLGSEVVQKQLAYWKGKLEGAPAVLELPQDKPRPAEQTLNGAQYTNAVPSEIISKSIAVAARHRATPFMLLQAAFKALLYRYSGQPDLLVGVPVAGRNQIETESLIGFFVDTVVLRDDLSGNPSFLNVLAQVRETTLDALANTEVPFDKIVEALQPERNLSYNPVFQVMFSVIKSAVRSHTFGSLSAYPYVVGTSASIVDLFATLIEDSDGKWWLQIDYNRDLFRQERIDRMFHDFMGILEAINIEPATRVDDLPVLNLSQPAKSAANGDSPRKGVAVANAGEFEREREEDGEVEEAVAQQAVLAEIWKDVLGIQHVGLHDNFFDIGGHSLLAARLIAQIQNVTGRKIPISAIFRAPTIASFAHHLKDDYLITPDPLLMELHQGQSGVPFFAIAAAGVDSTGLALLARQLGERQAVYKLQAPGPAVWGRPFEKEELRKLARDYVTAMRTVQPHGPYCLGGMCDGALIAQQIVLELESQGDEVGVFAIFDTWVLENSQIRPLWMVDYYLQRFRALPDLTMKEWLSLARRVLRRSLGLSGSNGNGWRETYWPGEEFQVPRFRAPILLFKRPRQPFYYTRDPQMGWGARTTGGVQICEVNCAHFELLRKPYVEFIGTQLAHSLREVNSQVGRSSLPVRTVQASGIQPGWLPAA